MRNELTTFPKSINDKYIPLDNMDHREMISLNVRNLPIINEVDDQINNNMEYESIIGYFNTKNNWYTNLIKNSSSDYTQAELGELLHNNEFLIGCDGGVRQQRAGIGIVTTTNLTMIIHNSVRIPDSYNDMTSYRCEAVGILGALYTRYANTWATKHHRVY
jgi:hypothetical protein